MKRLGITQRVEVVKSYGERRDCLDQKWWDFALSLGYLPVPLPNVAPKYAKKLVESLALDAVVLSGGNSIATLDTTAADAAPERDNFEHALIDYVMSQNIPLIGVCRGMQMINLHLEGQLTQIAGHVAVRHKLLQLNNEFPLPNEVNSYHNYGIPHNGLGNNLIPLASDDTENIEAYCHKKMPVLGIMWHPERETTFSQIDIQLIKRFLT